VSAIVKIFMIKYIAEKNCESTIYQITFSYVFI